MGVCAETKVVPLRVEESGVSLDDPTCGVLASAPVAAGGCGAVLAESALPELAGGKELFEVFELFFSEKFPLDDGAVEAAIDKSGGRLAI